MISINNISLKYKDKLLIKNANAELKESTLTALIGRNGTGKSTLLRAISGLKEVADGNILLNGKDINTLKTNEISRLIAFVSTERIRVANLTCKDVVSLGRSVYTNWIGRMKDEDKDIVMRSLEQVGMSSYANRTLDKMSDGECQKIMIARALAQTTPIILLDEPTSFLDLPGRYDLCRLLANLAHEEKKCILFSTHELDIAVSISDYITLIETPNFYFMPPDKIVENEHLKSFYKTNFRKLQTEF